MITTKIRSIVSRFDLDWKRRAITKKTSEAETLAIHKEWREQDRICDKLVSCVTNELTVGEILFMFVFPEYGTPMRPSTFNFPSEIALNNFRDIMSQVFFAVSYYMGAANVLNVSPKDLKLLTLVDEVRKRKSDVPTLQELMNAANLAAKNSAAAKRAAEQTAQATAAIAKRTVQGNRDLLDDLRPNTEKKDALAYMARLVCHVWITPPGKSKSSAIDYVFKTAKDGDRLWSDCQYARRLLNQYNYNPTTITKEAAMLHSRYTTWRKKSKKPYQPNIWRELVKESKRKERKSSRRR